MIQISGVFRLPSDGALADFAETTPDFTLFGVRCSLFYFWKIPLLYLKKSLLLTREADDLTYRTKEPGMRHML